MITLDQIETKVSEHFMKYGMNQPPRFILLDNKSYKKLNDSLKPKQRLNTEDDAKVKQDIAISKVKAGGAELEVLEVNTDEELFEVVG